MSQWDIDHEEGDQKKVVDYLRGVADAEEHYRAPGSRNNLFKRYVPPPVGLSIYSREWLKENQDLAKCDGYRYPLKLTAPPKPWEFGWELERKRDLSTRTDAERGGIVIESSRKQEGSRKRSSTQTELVGQRVQKRSVIRSEPKNIFERGGR